MIEKRLLNKTKIRKLFRDEYSLNAKNIELVSSGSAEIYKIDNEYILKLFQSKYTKKEILKEVKVINYLKKKNIPVPTYVKTNKNDYVVKIENRFLIVQYYIDGKTKDKFEGTIDEIKECGYLHGLIVKSLLGYKNVQIDKMDWYNKKENIAKIKKIIKMGNNKLIKEDLNKKISMIENLNYDFKDIDKITFYTSHGDFSYLQFIYDNGGVKAIIDFIKVKKLPIVWEIIRSFTYMDKDAKNGIINVDNLVLYVKEFMKLVPLSKTDLEYMPYIYVCQLLRSTYGYKEYYLNKNKEALQFAHFRTNLCEYLYKNAEMISKKLGELV